ncbi:MBL fold metallo-hydrolase [uncultured Gimesia sp.]|jgi:flavorubredoxin|uniref:MBL fold metallo-hydrolase n=1 Tax=uncultured Gimesia sp. TaxID=1678688 RepID=UPI002630D0F5|nr:MBL fold metallo-hydrolase [uncultured Gimesia sp.]
MFDFAPPTINEIAPDVFRLGCYAPALDLQFNYFLVRDDEPLLFTTGYKASFPQLLKAVQQIIDPATLRYIAFSHFESDECGALNQWLEVAPQAEPVCSLVSAMVNINDFAIRPPRGMNDGDLLSTGKYQYRFCSTAQLPHGWDAGLLYEETQGTLFCSDLFHQGGNGKPLTESDLSEQVRATMQQMQAGPLADYIPYTKQTDKILQKLAALKPKTLAIMHGSSFAGDGEQAFQNLSTAMKDVFG